MFAYSESYLKEVVETQGKLFDEVAEYAPGIDVKHFICDYMSSRTRRYIDEGQAYVITLDAKELWDYFCKTEDYVPVKGKPIKGFAADWIGEFYAYFQWYYNMASKKLLELIPVDFLQAAYHGLHDLEIDLAVKKIGAQVGAQNETDA